MKAKLYAMALCCTLLAVGAIRANAQSAVIQSKATFTYGEVQKMCGLVVDPAVRATAVAKEDSIYSSYLRHRSLIAPLTVTPNWRSMMTAVEYQDTDWCPSDCWAHSSTGVTEGRLHILCDSNLGINLDETEIVKNVLGYCDGNSIIAGMSYIENQRIQSQTGSYPNLPGSTWSLLQYTQYTGPDGVESALDSGPVTAGFSVYQDFVDFFNIPGNATAVYQHSGGGKALGSHAVVIVGYDDAGQYWLCKNSWGTAWADAGYFRIHFDTPQHFTGIDSYSNYSVSVDQSCYGKIVPNLINSLSTALSYPFWGEGNEIAYVTGTTTVSIDATVPSGATLQLNPGSTVQSASGKMIVVNGSISAVGTSSQPIVFDKSGSSAWYGLVLQSGSSGTVSYCNFNHATVGVSCNSSAFTISNCAFLNNYFGIYCNPCSPSILSNDIESSSNSGIYMTGASPNIQSNTIKNNSQYGIWCHSYSSPTRLYYNTITGSTTGLYIDYYSNPTLEPYGCNVFSMNSGYGAMVQAYYNCHPDLGDGSNDGYNSVLSPSYTYVSATSSCAVSAEYNWWGSASPNPSEFYADQSSSIDWSHPLNYNPNPGRPKVQAPNQMQPSPSIAPFSDSTFYLAFQAGQAGKYDEAIALYLKVFNANAPTSLLAKQALLFLAEAYERSGRTDFISYLQSQISPIAASNTELSVIVRELDAHWLVKAGRYADAIAMNQGLHADFASNADVDKFALFNVGEIYNLYLNDHANAVQALTLFQTKYPNDPLAPVAALLMSSTPGLSATSPQQGRGAVASSDPVPGKFALESNYPNPFNPSTQIRYSLSETGTVSLVIYDILGREVANLANGNQQAGRYTVTWNATQNSGIPVSSGVYFARIRVTDDIGGVKFAKTTRLLLMK